MSSDHAGVVVPPPLTYVPPLVAGVLVHFLWMPLRFLPGWWMGRRRMAAGPRRGPAVCMVA